MEKTPVGMIFAAGLGTRLKSLTKNRPKPLMEVAGKPIIFYTLSNLAKMGVSEVFINLHWLPQKIVDAVDKNFPNLKINFSYEPNILGTGGGLRQVINKFDLAERSIIAIHGDILWDVDLLPLVEAETAHCYTVARPSAEGKQ